MGHNDINHPTADLVNEEEEASPRMGLCIT